MKCETMWKYESEKWKLTIYSKLFQNVIELLFNLKKNCYTYFFFEYMILFLLIFRPKRTFSMSNFSFSTKEMFSLINKTFGPDLAPYSLGLAQSSYLMTGDRLTVQKNWNMSMCDGPCLSVRVLLFCAFAQCSDWAYVGVLLCVSTCSPSALQLINGANVFSTSSLI